MPTASLFFRGLLVSLLLAAALSACAGGGKPGPLVEAGGGGLMWMVPAAWQATEPRPMRLATHLVPSTTGEAELAVFFFPGGQGGSVEMNVERWLGQFKEPDGGPPRQLSRGVRHVEGVRITTLEVEGTFTAGGGPMDPAGEARPGYRLLAAIAEGPAGPVFFKMTGPGGAIDDARAGFDALLGSLRLAS